MELATYLVVLAIALSFCAKRNLVRSERVFFFIYLTTYLSLSLIIRTEFDTDIEIYANSMEYDLIIPYFLREPVVWFGQRWLFAVLESHYWVFVLFDLVVGVVLWLALRNLNAPQYVYFSMLIFFPFVLGMQNVYRQWVASVTFLFAISLADRKVASSMFWYIISILSHNVAALFCIVYLFGSRIIFRKTLIFLFFLITPLIMAYGSGTKSDASTAADLRIFYVLFFGLILISHVFVDGLKIRRDTFKEYGLIMALSYVAFVGALFLSSALSERVSMLAMTVLLPIMALKIETRIKQKWFVRVLLVIFGFVPIFFFETSSFILS